MIPQEDDDNKLIASSMRIPTWMRDALTRLAKEHKRSFNAELLWALEGYIEQEETGRRQKPRRESKR